MCPRMGAQLESKGDLASQSCGYYGSVSGKGNSA